MDSIRRKLISPDSKAKANAIALASLEKKSSDVLILQVANLTSISDYLVICSGDSERQVRAIADHIESICAEKQVLPLSIEGLRTSQWVLLDYGDVIAHIFRSDIRDHYGLEKLWHDATRVRLPSEDPKSPSTLLQPTKSKSDQIQKQG